MYIMLNDPTDGTPVIETVRTLSFNKETKTVTIILLSDEEISFIFPTEDEAYLFIKNLYSNGKINMSDHFFDLI